MHKKIITISREFGSGGRTIGKMAAEELGISCYDRELIERVAEKTGFAAEYVREQGEDVPARNLFAYVSAGRGMDGLSPEDYLWAAQSKVIWELAEKEPCVIVGRCADYVLRNRADCLNVFIHASMEKRAERIVRLYGERDTSPMKRLREKDKRRKVNYKYYTDREWGMAQNYHITLDSGELGQERCVQILTDLYKTEYV